MVQVYRCITNMFVARIFCEFRKTEGIVRCLFPRIWPFIVRKQNKSKLKIDFFAEVHRSIVLENFTNLATIWQSHSLKWTFSLVWKILDRESFINMSQLSHFFLRLSILMHFFPSLSKHASLINIGYVIGYIYTYT